MNSASIRLLLVDDDELTRRLLVRALENAGYETIECDNGREALQHIEAGEPMLLLLDYDMPELNGAQICELVRKHANPAIAALPIILLTGFADEEHEVECLRAGADDFALKPVNVTILKARIDTQIRLHTLRAQLQEQNAELERARREHELDLETARLTQQTILPARAPAIEGWELAAHYEPLIQVGGDIYDWLRLSDGSWLAWIADATGHGAAAALLTTLTKLVFRHAGTSATTPCGVLNAVNTEFHSVFKGRSYITGACVVIEPGSGEVRFAGAGHPPLLVARDSGEPELIASKAPPIGIRAELDCEESTVYIEPGETLLLYTDGLYSMTVGEGVRLAPADVAGMLPRRSESALDFLNQTMNAAQVLTRHESLPDDVAAIALRRV